jgi:hypothetical protein
MFLLDEVGDFYTQPDAAALRLATMILGARKVMTRDKAVFPALIFRDKSP